jgi:hypothetical protein
MQQLIDTSGAEGFRPALLLRRAHWAADAAAAARHRREALEACRRIGADGHAKRLADGVI